MTKAMVLTPMEELVLDVLAARLRLGENLWTFSSRLKPTLVKLEEKELIGFKSAPVEGAFLAWPTKRGKVLLFGGDYSPPLKSKKLKARQKELHAQAKRIKKELSRAEAV